MNQDKSRKPGYRSRSDEPLPRKSIPSPKHNATTDQKPAGGGFPIVGMGASAGGLEAFEKFFTHMAKDSGMAFVLVSHLDPEHASMLAELVSRFTPMPVTEVTDGMRVEANRVYTIPPNRQLGLGQGLLRLTTLTERRGLRLPIDTFFRSLAADQAERAIGIILSGNGSDGTLGLQAIHEAGGLVVVQDPATAAYDGMPVSAVHTGLADLVLPPEQMPQHLLAYIQQSAPGKKRRARKVGEPAPAPVQRILYLVREATGHDFSLYKSSTILRRIERRMTLHGIGDHHVYARYLEGNPPEIKKLFKEFLIPVTSFFRDAEAFKVIQERILPHLLENRPDQQPVRVWVPGCASGEEAFSLAMAFREYLDEHRCEHKITIFATDLGEEVITTARAGLYPFNISGDVSPERLQRFFVKEETGYRIKRDIREWVVFAVQNVIKDAPFTRLDLLSCRNLLIYLESELQEKLIHLFHYSLNPGGVLFLGSGESIGRFTDLFTGLERKWKFYQRRESAAAARRVDFTDITGIHKFFPPPPVPVSREAGVAELVQKTLLTHLTPPSVLVNDKGDIHYIHGRTGTYLEPAPGTGPMNILDMAREGCAFELRAALHQAATRHQDSQRRDLKVKANGGYVDVHLMVKYLNEPEGLEGMLLVVFEEVTPRPPAESKPQEAPDAGQDVAALTQELMLVKENLQATIEELQAANEELKSANEELQSTNKELQSTNEELETSKEEVQSVNEELMTVNMELQTKIDQLNRAESDIKNLLDSTTIATIFLDRHLCLTRFTPAATKVINLIATDIGRPIRHLASNLTYEALVADAQAVLDTLVPKELEAPTKDGNWLQVRIIPYRTVENVIDGVVITCNDINRVKAAEGKAQAAQQYAENIVETVREPLLVVDAGLRVVSANRAFYDFFQVQPEETTGKLIFDLGQSQWDIPELRRLLQEILPKKTTLQDFRVEHDFPGIGRRNMLLNARRMEHQGNSALLILLALEDVTGKK
jgi:two-component system, chemotaxis family, CheB/CheR fusion protein